jgi:hypothetical protein
MLEKALLRSRRRQSALISGRDGNVFAPTDVGGYFLNDL